MKKTKKQGISDTDKAVAGPGIETEDESNMSLHDPVSPDAFLAEKDEVKIAEEKLRKNKKPNK